MKSIQIISGLSTLLFIGKVYVVSSHEAKAECFLASIVFLLIFILSSHFIGMDNIKKKDIADEIKENHFNKLNKRKRTTNVGDV